jgi:hypothetical protein
MEDGKEKKAAKESTENLGEAANPVKEFFEKKGKESTENLAKGGSEATISLVNKVNVEFIEDYGFIKKGHTQEVSESAFEIYNDLKVIKKI